MGVGGSTQEEKASGVLSVPKKETTPSKGRRYEREEVLRKSCNFP